MEDLMTASPLPARACSIVINVPLQAVWDEITKTGSVQKPLFNTVLDIDLRPGGSLRYLSADRSRVFIAGEVLEVEAPRKLRHTYIFTMSPEPITEVTWELEEVPEGCRVTVTHAGWTTQKDVDKHGAGWVQILDLLKSQLENGDIPAKTKLIYMLQGWFMWAMPAATKAKNWT